MGDTDKRLENKKTAGKQIWEKRLGKDWEKTGSVSLPAPTLPSLFRSFSPFLPLPVSDLGGIFSSNSSLLQFALTMVTAPASCTTAFSLCSSRRRAIRMQLLVLLISKSSLCLLGVRGRGEEG